MTLPSHDLRRASELTWILMFLRLKGEIKLAIFFNCGCACYFCKSIFCVNASLYIYSLKITTSSMLVLAPRFFTSTHLHAFSRLEKCMHTDHCERFRGLNTRFSCSSSWSWCTVSLRKRCLLGNLVQPFSFNRCSTSFLSLSDSTPAGVFQGSGTMFCAR